MNQFVDQEGLSSLLLEVLMKSDVKVLELMNDHMETFISFIQKNQGQVGIKWDDVIVRFEWQIEIE